jgi:uncharacterized membrane protein YdjX (TVP38/TMEM64 family)
MQYEEHSSMGAAGATSAPAPAWRRFLPLAVILAAIALAFWLRLDRYLTFEALAQNRQWLLGQVASLGIAAPILFALVYAAAAALSIPGAIILTLAGGFLFGVAVGGLAVVIGATIGAAIIFTVAKTALGESLRAKAGPFIQKLEAGFRKDAFSYLLFLRLVPIFPFWLVNLVPAFLGVSLRVFVTATFIGIIPGSLVYTWVGSGLGAVFDRGEEPDLRIIFEPQIIGPIIGLAVLALVPIVIKRLRRPSAGEAA